LSTERRREFFPQTPGEGWANRVSVYYLQRIVEPVDAGSEHGDGTVALPA
jgi:hypothetical protein